RWRVPRLRSLEDRQETYPLQATEMAIKSSSVRRKSRTLAWRPSTSSTEKVATVHLRWWSLSAVAAVVMVAEAAVMVVGGATLVAAAEVAITAAAATAAEAAATAAAAAVASALG